MDPANPSKIQDLKTIFLSLALDELNVDPSNVAISFVFTEALGGPNPFIDLITSPISRA